MGSYLDFLTISSYSIPFEFESPPSTLGDFPIMAAKGLTFLAEPDELAFSSDFGLCFVVSFLDSFSGDDFSFLTLGGLFSFDFLGGLVSGLFSDFLGLLGFFFVSSSLEFDFLAFLGNAAFSCALLFLSLAFDFGSSLFFSSELGSTSLVF